MPDATSIVDLARKHIGEEYVLGAKVAYDNPNHKGPWDCAEFVTWAVYQATGVILGCRPLKPNNSEAYTGYWFDDATRLGLVISIADALAMPGALIGRKATSSRIGHIAISIGDGESVVEAAGKNIGVAERSAIGRPWDLGIRVPLSGSTGTVTTQPAGPDRIFRASQDPVFQPEVQAIQQALKDRGFDPGPIDGLFGEWTERAVINFQNQQGLVVDGIVGRQTGRALELTFWDDQTAITPVAAGGTYNGKYKVTFQSLVAGGFYSGDPDDMTVKRSIRTNNPGALNISGWQQTFAGYVGKTKPDAAGNETTIYRTPEHGAAAWYHLVTGRYGYGLNGSVRIGALAMRYAGAASEDSNSAKAYINGWGAASGGVLMRDTVIPLGDAAQVLVLAKAMFHHEIGAPSPLQDAQINYAVTNWRNGTLPA